MRGSVATALMLVAGAALLPASASADAISEPSRPGWSPEGYLLSISVGAYRPDPGYDIFDQVYPGDNGPILLGEFDIFLYRIPFVGPFGIGVVGGWSAYKGNACIVGAGGGCTPSTDGAKFTLFPINASFVLRVDGLARYTPVPLVFSGKIGYNSVFFNERVSGAKSSGRSHGFGWAAQIALELNFVNPRRANALDEDWGINSSFFFFELGGSDANSRAQVGDKLYFTGGVGITF